MPVSRARRIARGLARLLRVARRLPDACRAVGGWRQLSVQLRAERRGGWRRAYGTLLGCAALGGRGRTRDYRRWLAGAERGAARPLDRRVVVVAGLAGLDAAAAGRFATRLAAAAPNSRIFVDAQAPGLRAACAALAAAGADHAAMGDALDAAALPAECIGAVFLFRPALPNPRHGAALAAALEGGADLVYGDADEMARGGRRRPRFKPAFCSDLFCRWDYLSDCVAVSRRVLERDPRCDFADPRGTVLRWIGADARVAHLPVVLSHALGTPDSGPGAGPSPALDAFLRRRFGPGAGVEETADGGWRCAFGSARRTAKIAVAIPTRDRIDLLAPCVDSLYAANARRAFETLIVDNRSERAETRDWLRQAERARDGLRVITADCPFNWSRLNNLAIAASDADVFVFLNNDTTSISRDWLERLADYALRPDVGAVGALLLFGDGRIQHAGLVVGHGDCADPLYRGMHPRFGDVAFVPPQLPREVSAVTGACLAASAATLRAIGLFDERFPIAGDVELCLRARAAGLRNLYAGDVALHHHESRSRDPRSVRDMPRLRRLVAGGGAADPFYNPNLAAVAGIGRGAPAFALLHGDTSAPDLRAARRGD